MSFKKVLPAAPAFLFLFTISCTPSPTPPVDPPGDQPYVPSGPCDEGLAIDSTDPLDAAHAMGISDGLVSAEWVLPDGSAKPANPNFDIGHGILSGFGTNVAVREGSRLLALSTGTARQPSDPGYSAPANGFEKKAVPSDPNGYTCQAPAGYPIAEPSGPSISSTGYDGIALKVVLNIPSGVSAYGVDYKYYTKDHPAYIKSAYSDQCCALLVPPCSGLVPENNFLFDSSGIPLFSSSSAIKVGAGLTYGTTELIGTGFESNGATEWLMAVVPTADLGSQITITFAIWDSGDSAGDSTLLLDNFRWIPEE